MMEVRSKHHVLYLLCFLVAVCLRSIQSSVSFIVDSTAASWNPAASPSPASSPAPTLLDSEDIKSNEYTVFDHACLQVTGPEESILLVTTNATKHDHVMEIRFYRGDSFRMHKMQVKYVNDFNTANVLEKGSYLLTSHHTPDNNFHLHSDLLLPVWRAYLKTKIDGLLLFEGCVSCWKNRLSMMSHIFEMMNLQVVYPMESMNKTTTCFDRLIIRKEGKAPYYSHEGRFSPYWPQQILSGYRDKAHDYFRSLPMQKNNSSASSTPIKINASKPVLSWISRSYVNCTRCITNERDMVEELSKYFHVNLLDFRAGLTVEESMAYIMDTDVLVGLHGAGLGYTCLLPDRAMVVEIKSDFGKEKKMCLNMASMLNLPYYSVSMNGIGKVGPDRHEVPSDIVRSMAKEIHDASKYEREQPKNKNYTGECLFPERLEPHGHLSSMESSRCYLEQSRGTWWQCVHFGYCK